VPGNNPDHSSMPAARKTAAAKAAGESKLTPFFHAAVQSADKAKGTDAAEGTDAAKESEAPAAVEDVGNAAHETREEATAAALTPAKEQGPKAGEPAAQAQEQKPISEDTAAAALEPVKQPSPGAVCTAAAATAGRLLHLKQAGPEVLKALAAGGTDSLAGSSTAEPSFNFNLGSGDFASMVRLQAAKIAGSQPPAPPPQPRASSASSGSVSGPAERRGRGDSPWERCKS